MTTERQLEPVSQGITPIQHASGATEQGHVPGAAPEEEVASFGVRVDSGMPEGAIARIPIEIDVAVPIRKFRVRNLLGLTTGQVIATQWPEGEDLPLGARGAQLAWTEFEVIDQKLAVRITRLA